MWQQFLAATTVIPTLHYHWPQWHQGRQRFCFWGLLPECEALDKALSSLRQPLSAYLLDDYHKQTHITLYAAGFPCDIAQLSGDVSEAELDRQEAAIQKLKLPPLQLKTASINSFAGAPFVEVTDEAGHLQVLHKTLSKLCGADRDGELVPHLTLGLYRSAFAVADIAKTLQGLNLDSLNIRCNSVHLLAYQAADIRSPLISLRQVPFTAQAY